MTTANVKIRILAALLCLVALVAFSACSKDNDDPSKLEGLELAQNKENVSRYLLVLPSDSGASVAQSADALALSIAQRTGVDCDVYYENDNIPHVENAIIVLIGDVEHSYSVQYIHSLKRDDYVCRAGKEYIVLGGKSDAANVAAMAHLNEEILPYCDGKLIMRENDGFEHYAEYELGSLTVCGVRFGSYGIVCYPERGSAEARLVGELREKVADRCGEYPELIYSTQSTENVREILMIVDPALQNAARVSYDGEDVVIKANGTYGLSVGIKMLYADMFSAINEGTAAFDMEIGDVKIYAQNTPSVTVSTVFEDIPKNTALVDGALAFANTLKQSGADVLYLPEVDAEVWDIVKNNLGSSYGVISFDVDMQSRAAFVYNKSRLTYDSKATDSKNADGVFFGEICFDVDGERIKICAVGGGTADIGENEISSIFSSLTDDSAYAVALIGFSDASERDLTREGVDTVHNGTLAVGEDQHRVCILTQTGSFDASEAQTVAESYFGSVTAKLSVSVCRDVFGS